MKKIQKKVFVLMVCLFFINKNFAQIEKGDFLVPLNLMLNYKLNYDGVEFYDNSKNTFKYTTFNYNINSGIGYSIFKNVIIGVAINHENKKRNNYLPNNTIYKHKEMMTLFGPNVRYYLKNNQFGFFIEGSYLIGKPKSLFEWPSNRIITTSAVKKNLGLGINYFITKKIIFEVIPSFSKNQFNVNLSDLGKVGEYKSQKLSVSEIKLNLGISYKL